MIKFLCEKSGQYFLIIINDKKIWYSDKAQSAAWGGPLQYLPPDPSASKRIDMSRNRIPQVVKELLVIPKDELKQFENAKDDNELKELVIKDLKRNQCKIIDLKIE